MEEIREYEGPEGWAGHVEFAPGHEGFAYRPSEVITGERGLETAQRRFPGIFPEAEAEPVFPEANEEASGSPQLYLLRGEMDPVEVVEELSAEGVPAQPNHVLFTHGEGCCGPHPAQRWQGCLSGSPMYGSPMYGSPMYGSPMYGSPMYGSPMYGSPMYGSPMYGSPMYGSPMYGSPMYGSPMYGSPMYGSPMYGSPMYGSSEVQASGRRRSSAKPASAPTLARVASANPARAVRVVVLDTGMAGDGYRPPELDAMAPDRAHWERPDTDGDNELDPAAGHGTFIAGLIDLVTPGCEITVEKVLSSYGEGDEVAVARRVHALAGTVDLMNLSFGGYAMERMNVLAAAIRRAKTLGTVVVASAGNDGTCRPQYPAALRDVVGVGAIGPTGPAPFTNYGPWVRACAPGVDVVSWFFLDFNGPDAAPPGSSDPDHFQSWARWSGTSFAAPVVVAALAREMFTFNVSAFEAVAAVIDRPGLLKLPDLGTVVNQL